jgi:hypothetical protein
MKKAGKDPVEVVKAVDLFSLKERESPCNDRELEAEVNKDSEFVRAMDLFSRDERESTCKDSDSGVEVLEEEGYRMVLNQV